MTTMTEDLRETHHLLVQNINTLLRKQKRVLDAPPSVTKLATLDAIRYSLRELRSTHKFLLDTQHHD